MAKGERTNRLKIRLIGIAVICIIIVTAAIIVKAADVEVKLNSSDGSTYFEIQDSGGSGVFTVDSDGNVAIGTTDPGSYALYVSGDTYINGDFTVDAGHTKSSAVNTSKGKVRFYSIEAPEVRVEDFGTAQLVNGEAKVKIDSLFREGISDKEEYQVFVALLDDCNGVYIAKKSPNHFTVKEIKDGKSSSRFEWRIIGKVKGLEDRRMEKVKK